MLDRLPDPILLDLIRYTPQLGLVNRKLFGLSELLTRSRLLSYYDYSDEQIDDLAEDIRQHLKFESWAAVENVANRDYWIFGPEHVKPCIPSIDDDLEGLKRSIESKTLGIYSPKRIPEGYHVISGAPFGLHVVQWGSQCLEYTTRLRAGRYQVFLDVLIAQLAELSKTRFRIVRSPTVKQYFTSVPPYQWLERQSQCISNELNGNQSIDSEGAFYGMDLESTKLYMGMLDVGSTETSDWAEVTLRIECLDWSHSTLGLIFNYLYFERHPRRSSFALDWVVQPSTAALPNPTYALTTVYKRANERKRRWSQKSRIDTCSPTLFDTHKLA